MKQPMTPPTEIDALKAELEMLRDYVGSSYLLSDFQNVQQIRDALAAMTAEREKWKASHDNQVKLRRMLMDRPDLKERAKLVSELSEQNDKLRAEVEAGKLEVCAIIRQNAEFTKAVYDGQMAIRTRLTSELDAVRKDLDFYKSFVGAEVFQSDYQTVGDMRKAIDAAQARCDALEKALRLVQPHLKAILKDLGLSGEVLHGTKIQTAWNAMQELLAPDQQATVGEAIDAVLDEPTEPIEHQASPAVAQSEHPKELDPMKVSKRAVPNDILSFEHKEYSVYVGTNRNVLDIRIRQDDRVILWQSMTPEQFISLLMRYAHGH